MSRLYGRSARIIAGSLLVEGLRVQFKVKKTLEKAPNECEATIYNLSEQSRSGLQSKGTRVALEAGYGGTIAQIFSGDARLIDHTHEGSDWLTKIQCGDGERAYRFARVADSFKAGTSRGAVFQRVAGALGIDTRDAVSTVKGIAGTFVNGYSAFGKASTQIDQLLQGTGYGWSIQDGKLQVLPEDGALRDSAVLLNADTGLVGSPAHGSPADGAAQRGQRKPQLLKVKSLLQPSIRPGGRVQIESVAIRGTFRVVTVVHTGDTHGSEWYSEAEVTPL